VKPKRECPDSAECFRRMDSDGVASALKAVRDGIADALGIDDGNSRITWIYGQERGEYSVRVEIESEGGQR